MSVIAFGDSHVFCAAAGGAQAVHAGAVTLHRLGREGEAPRLLGAQTCDAVMVLAGEIDVRAHVAVQIRERGRDAAEVIEDLSDAALWCLSDLRAAGFVAVMCAVIPPTGKEGPSGGPLPFRGSLAERAGWAQALNAAMYERLGSRLVDPYAEFRSQDGTLLPSCSDGSVHLDKRFGPQAFGALIRELERR